MAEEQLEQLQLQVNQATGRMEDEVRVSLKKRESAAKGPEDGDSTLTVTLTFTLTLKDRGWDSRG